MTHVGFTGTRHGMTPSQKVKVRAKLTRYLAIGAVFHHGGCAGADVEAAAIARELGYRVVRHPGPDPARALDPVAAAALVGESVDDETRERASHFTRNRAIVDECSVLIATPLAGEPPPMKAGGTWYTINYALRIGKPMSIYLIGPDEKETTT